MSNRERNKFFQYLRGTQLGSDLSRRSREPSFEEPLPEPPQPNEKLTNCPGLEETFNDPKPIKKKPAPSNKPASNNRNGNNQDRLWQKLYLLLRLLVGISTEQNVDNSVISPAASDRFFHNFDGTLDHHTDRSTVNPDTLLNTPLQSNTPKSTGMPDATDIKISLEAKAVVSESISTPDPIEETEIATPIAESFLQDNEIDFTESSELLNTAVEEEQFVADPVLDEILVSDRLEGLNVDDNPSIDIPVISLEEFNSTVVEQSTEENVDQSNTNETTNQGESSVLEENPQVPVEPTISAENPQVPVEPTISEENPQVPVEPTISEENPQVPVEPTISEENPQVPETPAVSEENPQVPETPQVPEEEPSDEIDDNIIDASGGNKTIVVEAGDKVIITNFTGIGTGTNPSQAILEELDTVQFIGEGLEAKSLQLRQEGEDLILSFEGDTADTSVVLQGVQLEDIDNIPINEANSVFVGNILFNGDEVLVEDSFDVFDAQSNQQSVFSSNTVTFLNDLDNDVQGFAASEDVINAGEGNDRLAGLSGDDLLRGEQGNDTLLGGLGNDTLVGGSGDDLLNGGSGSNTYTGGAGNDQFTISEESTNLITDFTSGEDQLILPDNFPINALQIELGTSSDNGSSTIISSSSGQILAILWDVHPDSISGSDFGFLND
ncbi:MAG: hypothetical protein F6J86_39720 [Symploca sp. SIO1B1]|nr:hypothetical protein [Symploca sp. SIO1B1]